MGKSKLGKPEINFEDMVRFTKLIEGHRKLLEAIGRL